LLALVVGIDCGLVDHGPEFGLTQRTHGTTVTVAKAVTTRLCMGFRFRLTRPTGTRLSDERLEERGPLEDDSSYEYLAMRGCAELAATDASFLIGGFGRKDWEFDISYDLSALMESLPELIAAVRHQQRFELDLYPQGVERTLTFRFPEGETVEVDCRSRTAWTPNPVTEVCDRAELLAMCTGLASDFAASLHAIGSDVAELSPFCAWSRG
jgi:hypothetical protein